MWMEGGVSNISVPLLLIWARLLAHQIIILSALWMRESLWMGKEDSVQNKLKHIVTRELSCLTQNFTLYTGLWTQTLCKLRAVTLCYITISNNTTINSTGSILVTCPPIITGDKPILLILLVLEIYKGTFTLYTHHNSLPPTVELNTACG